MRLLMDMGFLWGMIKMEPGRARWWLHRIVSILKKHNTELYTLKGCILWYVNDIL